MPYLANPKLGILGSEITLTFIRPAFSITHNDKAVETDNIQGDYRKSILKVNVPALSVQAIKLPIADYNILSGFKQRQAILNFMYRDDLQTIDEQNTSTDSTHITLLNTGATGITILGVWRLTDPTHAGTNYYSGGSSYNATTRVITLATPLPGATTDVLINYAYTGNSVIIRGLNLQAMTGLQKIYYTASLELEGV